MNEHEWRASAVRVVADLLSAPWEFGDWALAADGLGLTGERTEILNSDPRWEGTELAHYAYVAMRIPLARRRPVPWSYHDAVARLPPSTQDRLLDLSESEAWTLQEIRRAAREAAKEQV